MNRWPRVSLGAICESIDYGVTASASELPCGPKFLRITDIQDDSVDWSAVPWCSCSERELESSRLQSGDIVFARTGATTGKSFLISDCPTDAVFASYLIRVRPKECIEPRFVRHYFKTSDYWAQITKGARGAAQPGVNATTLKALEIPLPPLAEQRRIAAILDQADALRTKRREALALLDALQRGIFVEMFGDPVTNPKRWSSELSLGDVADIVSGVTKGRKLEGKVTREVPYLAVANVQDMCLDLEKVKRIDATEDEISRYVLKEGDLLLTEGGDPDKLGRGGLWNEELPECIHQNHVFRVRLKSDILTPYYLNWLIGSQRGKRYFLQSAKQTTGIASINMTQLRGFPLLLPPLDLQKEFGKALVEVNEQRTRLNAAHQTTDNLFASLQHGAFRGEL